MDAPNTTNTSGTLDADEEILTYTTSDEALEAASGIEKGFFDTMPFATAWICGCGQRH
jgi:hypothetical protein